MERRNKTPGDPTRFSIRLSESNLNRLEKIHQDMQLDNRNKTINAIIADYYTFHESRDLIEALDRRYKKR